MSRESRNDVPALDPPSKRMAWCCVALAAIILFIRKTDAFLNPQFWGEDALPFFIDSLFVGPEAILIPYSGYSHLLPRLIAWAATFLDVAYAPAFYVYTSLLGTLAIVALAISPRLKLPGLPLIALAIVIVPHSGEVFLTPTNLQWITALGIFLTLLKADPVTPGDWAVDALVIVLAGLSGPFVVVLLPFFAGRACFRRTPSSWIIVALVTLIAGVQAWLLVRTPQPAPLDSPVQWQQLAAVFSLQVPLSIFGAPAWSKDITPSAAIIMGGAALVFFAWVSLVPRPPGFRAVIAMWTFGAILVVAAEKRVRFDNLLLDDFDMADRYFFIPKVLLLWLLATAASRHPVRGRAAAAALVIAVVASLSIFRFEPLRDLEWKNYSDRLRAGEPVTVPINPDWIAEFPARRVSR